jgi:hypothetical protein
LDTINDLSKQQMKAETTNTELQKQVEVLRKANEILSKQTQQLSKSATIKSPRPPLVETRSFSCESLLAKRMQSLKDFNNEACTF